MNYYKMRLMIAEDAKGFLKAYPDYPFQEFSQNMVKKYGVSKKIVNNILEEAHGVRFENDKMVRV